MAQNSKNKNTLRNLPFYSEETKRVLKKRTKKLLISSFYLNYHFLVKNLKN